MSIYGKTLAEKGGLTLVEVLAEGFSEDGEPMVVGYAILDQNGVEIESFDLSNLDNAFIRLDKLSEEYATLNGQSKEPGIKPKFGI